MKTKLFLIGASVLLGAVCGARGQGTFVYDQQSATGFVPQDLMVEIEFNQPMGQSFVPAQSSIGFIQLELGDATLNGLGATVYVNLRSDSISGPVLGSTQPVFMADNYFGITTFLFSTAVSLTPGTTYYFQPVVDSGDKWRVNTLAGFNYVNGTAFFKGVADSSSDFWFREGMVVPEPSATWLILIGGGVLFYVRRRYNKRCSHS